ncbi:MAG: sugar phosphate isomerase/epimerase [Ferruginibacter sp.]
MYTRRNFLKNTGALTIGSALLSSFDMAANNTDNPGIQLYTVRKQMLADAAGTLKKLAALGIKQIESARSEKGHYYGFKPAEMKNICSGLGMTLRSGHAHLDDNWQQTMEEAVISGQEYLVCSSLPTNGQTVDNYKKVAEAFNKAGEACKTLNLKFGYHNHEYEFEQESGKVLYDVLLENTDPNVVFMEMDIGWAIVAGKGPLDYFSRYPGRFLLWHLKDMDMVKKQSTEFGKGGLDIKKMFDNSGTSGLKYYFIEQEEYSSSPFESMKHNMEYLKKIK